MAANTLPPEVDFAENCNWLETLRPGAAGKSIFGARYGLPADLYANTSESAPKVLTPVMQTIVRSWDPDAGGPPAFSANEDDIQVQALVPVISPPVLAAQQASSGGPLTLFNTQCRWRLAWPVKPNPCWNYIHFRWVMAIYNLRVESDGFDWRTPASLGADIDEVRWSLGFDVAPGNYLEARPVTWPGSPWIEAEVPDYDPVTRYAQACFYPVWPFPDALFSSDPEFPFVERLRGFRQGLVPGMLDLADQYRYLQLAAGTVVSL